MAGRLARWLAVALVLASLWGTAAWLDRPPVPVGTWLADGGLEARHVHVGGHRLRYVRAGAGPPVVLVHGFASSLYTWKDVLPGLARAHDVVAFDLPGFGGSDQPADLAFDDFPESVLGLMNALDLDRAALVGNSLGGAAVAVVASESPARVSALVLIDSAGFNLAAADRPAMVRLASSPAGRLLELLPLRRPAVFVSLRQVFHDPALVTDDRVAEYLAPLLRPGAIRSIRSLASGPARDAGEVARALDRIEAPTLVVWGRDDRWIPVADADRFVSAIPGAEKAVLEDSGHVPQEERPAVVAEVLLRFLAGRDAPRAGAEGGSPTGARE